MYGTFNEGVSLPRRPGGLTPPPNAGGIAGSADIAIEILREFSASELVGKIYVKSRAGNWVPVSEPGVRDFSWYKAFRTTKSVEFRMDGSDPWKVLYFRVESDDAGPYVAVGLKLSR